MSQRISNAIASHFLHSFSTGVGAIINYMAVWTVFLQNFAVEYGGRAAVAVAVGIRSSLSFASAKTIHQDQTIITARIRRMGKVMFSVC